MPSVEIYLRRHNAEEHVPGTRRSYWVPRHDGASHEKAIGAWREDLLGLDPTPERAQALIARLGEPRAYPEVRMFTAGDE